MRSLATILFALTVSGAGGGCALTHSALPAMGGVEPSAGSVAASDEAEEIYRRIQQAKSQHAIVLQVAGDSEPIRVLPLPPDGRAVFVSDLLEQTGVFKRFGRVQADLFRDSPSDLLGVRMAVQMERGRVRPESDYALRPGDRLRVQKDTTSALTEFISEWVPGNAVRAFAGP